MESTQPAAEKKPPRNLAEALQLLATPVEVSLPAVLLADGQPAAVRMRQQSALVWQQELAIFPLMTKPKPKLYEDPGADLEWFRQWREMGWTMCKRAVYLMRDAAPETAPGEPDRWVSVRLVEDGAARAEGDIERSLFTEFCLDASFLALVSDFNTLQGVRLDEPGFRDEEVEGTPLPVEPDGGEVRTATPRDDAGDA